MTQDQIEYLIHHLKEDGVSFDAALTTEEVQQVEQTFGFHFPPDLRAFLQTALPISDGFIPWRWALRNPDIAHKITERLEWPIDEIVFDVRKGTFWRSQWGACPEGELQREVIARQHLAGCPKLIPIYSHRYLPELPSEIGNPVFSVWGTDIVYYGYDLLSYLVQEFNLYYPASARTPSLPKYILFWGDFDKPKGNIHWGYWDGTEEQVD